MKSTSGVNEEILTAGILQLFFTFLAEIGADVPLITPLAASLLYYKVKN
jgi:hypothetical protein